MPLVSIIVPVYNVEQFLPQCLDSLLNQTLCDIEIICVDDVTPDNCANILLEYAKKDKRIKIVTHELNQGLGAARNSGVAIATADYIGFVDSDDYVAESMFETLYTAISKANSELAWCGMSSVQEDGYNYKTGSSIPEGVYTTKEVLNSNRLYPSILSVCNKLFVRDLIKDIKQLPIISEDQPILAEYFCKCERIVVVNQPFYVYRNRQGTLSKPASHTPDQWNAFFYAHDLFFELLSKRFNAPDLRVQSVLRYFSLFWNIDNFKLLNADNWTIQQHAIRTQVKKGSMQLKKANLLMYWFLLLFLSDNVSNSYKNKLLKTGLKLSRTAWLRKYSLITLPFDLFELSLPTIKLKILKTLDTVEIWFVKLLAKAYCTLYSSKIWLVGERIDTAQENGIYFFNYLQTEQPQEKAYYVFDKQAILPNNLQNNKQLLAYNSLKHKLLFLLSACYVNSHFNTCFPKTRFGKKRYPISSKTKNIFLQHGITLTDVSPFYGKEASGIDLFVCGAQPEYEFVKSDFGYESSEVVLTGFARFDGLHDSMVKKQILLMPSWRRTIWNKDPNYNIQLFLNTAYYKEFQQLLNNEDLISLLETYDYQLVFYPHYEIQNYLHCFTKTSDRIVFANKVRYTVQQLLKDSALLITDSSSVSFDFGYMYKPLLYYHFEEEADCQEEIEISYFQDRESGFGDVVDNEEKLIKNLDKLLSTNCEMETKYRERVKSFFPLYDNKNCERIYHAIINK